MKKNQIIFILLLSIQFVVKYSNAQDKTIQMKSIVLNTSLDENGNFSYQLNYKGKPILNNSKIGFEFSKPNVLLNRFEIIKIDTNSFDQKWAPVGENRIVFKIITKK